MRVDHPHHAGALRFLETTIKPFLNKLLAVQQVQARSPAHHSDSSRNHPIAATITDQVSSGMGGPPDLRTMSPHLSARSSDEAVGGKSSRRNANAPCGSSIVSRYGQWSLGGLGGLPEPREALSEGPKQLRKLSRGASQAQGAPPRLLPRGGFARRACGGLPRHGARRSLLRRKVAARSRHSPFPRAGAPALPTLAP